jgi:serine/threonine protein kinase
MQRLHGQTVADLLERSGRLSSTRAAEIALSVASALAVAHANDIVHRDLKPANIFLHLDPDLGEVVKVLDFGVSKVLTGDDATSTATGTAIGSPAYMSPEQARGDRALDHRTDIWSFGVVLFEMIAGRAPFKGATTYALVSNILTGPLPSLEEAVPHCNPVLCELVSRCLQRNVARRPESADELIRELRTIVRASASVVSARDASAELIVLNAPPRSTLEQASTLIASTASAQSGATQTSTYGASRHLGRMRRAAWMAGGVIAAATVIGAVALLATSRGSSPSDSSAAAGLTSGAALVTATTAAPPSPAPSIEVVPEQDAGPTHLHTTELASERTLEKPTEAGKAAQRAIAKPIPRRAQAPAPTSTPATKPKAETKAGLPESPW